MIYDVPQHPATKHDHDTDDVYAKHTGVVRVLGYGHHSDDQLFSEQVAA